MKTLLIALFMLFSAGLWAQGGSHTLYGEFVESDTITSDTLYVLKTSDVYFWNLQITTTGITDQDTVWVKIRQSSDNQTSWADFANMDSIQLTEAKPWKPFEDWWNGGTHLGMYVNLGVLDTIVVTRVGYVLRPNNQ